MTAGDGILGGRAERQTGVEIDSPLIDLVALNVECGRRNEVSKNVRASPPHAICACVPPVVEIKQEGAVAGQERAKGSELFKTRFFRVDVTQYVSKERNDRERLAGEGKRLLCHSPLGHTFMGQVSLLPPRPSQRCYPEGNLPRPRERQEVRRAKSVPCSYVQPAFLPRRCGGRLHGLRAR